VELAAKKPVLKYNWMGGKVPSIQEVLDLAKQDFKQPVTVRG